MTIDESINPIPNNSLLRKKDQSILALHSSDLMRGEFASYPRVNLIVYGMQEDIGRKAKDYLFSRGVYIDTLVEASFDLDGYRKDGEPQVVTDTKGTRYNLFDSTVYVKCNMLVNPSLPIIIVANNFKYGRHFASLLEVLEKYMEYSFAEHPQALAIVPNFGIEGADYDHAYTDAILQLNFDLRRQDLQRHSIIEQVSFLTNGFSVRPLFLGEQIF